MAELSLQSYTQKKSQLLQQKRDQDLSGITFSDKEARADSIWQKMLQADRFNRSHTYYHNYTLKHREEYEQKDIFKVIAQLPKGATLHIHCDCCIDEEWFLREVAFNGYTYLNRETGFFSYFATEDRAKPGYTNLVKIREEIGEEAIIADLKKRLKVTQEESENYNADVWSIFETKIISFGDLLHTKSFWGIYLKNVFKNFIDEGITRIEGRAFVGWLKDDDDQPVSLEEEFAIYEQVIKETQQYCPEFTFGMVIQGLKCWDREETTKYYRQAFELRKKYPHIVIAYDMVQEEDCHKNSEMLAEVFSSNKTQLEQEFGIEFPFCFHGGETIDTQLNQNLYNVISLGSKRIGHGINLIQWGSSLIEEVKKNDICLEICIVSNQVLRYYNDLRTHPLKPLLNAGVKCALSPDDPGFFGARAVNHDFYCATIGARLTLSELKKLVFYSISSTFQTKEEQQKLASQVSGKWDLFVDWFLQTYDNEQHIKGLDTIIGDHPAKFFQ